MALNQEHNMLNRLKKGLFKTHQQLFGGLARIVHGPKELDPTLLDQLETQLIMADVGVTVTQTLIQHLSQKLSRDELQNNNAVLEALKKDLIDILLPVESPLVVKNCHKPFVILMIGVNGSGKTTTIAKLAKRFQDDHKTVLLAAGDTFRAAAIEQLQVWGDRHHIPVIAQQSGADCAAVIFDALQSSQARKTDILIADTAGRLHTQTPLMDELKKIKRVMTKLDTTAPHEILLVLDAGNGQNALQQARQFHAALGVTGLILTKLDGTAKGGILFAIASELKIPIRFIGVGEQVDDLRPFQAVEFVEALFQERDL